MLAQDVLTEDEVLMEVKTLIKNISERSLTLLIFAVKWALCGGTQAEHESMMPLVSRSHCLVILKDS